MWPYHPDLLARPVPRYTSYPTAAEFGGHVSDADMRAALDAVEADTVVSLYLHIPWMGFPLRFCFLHYIITHSGKVIAWSRDDRGA